MFMLHCSPFLLVTDPTIHVVAHVTAFMFIVKQRLPFLLF